MINRESETSRSILEAHFAQIEAVRDKLHSHSDKELRDISTVIHEVQNDLARAKGQRNCWRLGDLIVALEVPEDAQIYTTNLRHFEAICIAIGGISLFAE